MLMTFFFLLWVGDLCVIAETTLKGSEFNALFYQQYMLFPFIFIFNAHCKHTQIQNDSTKNLSSFGDFFIISVWIYSGL